MPVCGAAGARGLAGKRKTCASPSSAPVSMPWTQACSAQKLAYAAWLDMVTSHPPQGAAQLAPGASLVSVNLRITIGSGVPVPVPWTVVLQNPNYVGRVQQARKRRQSCQTPVELHASVSATACIWLQSGHLRRFVHNAKPACHCSGLKIALLRSQVCEGQLLWCPCYPVDNQ